MKIQKLITLDLELIKKLKQEENASGLINELLNEYYKKDKTTEDLNKTQEEFQNKINSLETEKTNIEKEISKQNIIDEVNLTDEIKDWFMRKIGEPTPSEIDSFLKGNEILKTKTILEYIKDWRKIQNVK